MANVDRLTVTPLPGSAIGGPSITLSANEIRPKTAVPIALMAGGTSICGADAMTVDGVSAGVDNAMSVCVGSRVTALAMRWAIACGATGMAGSSATTVAFVASASTVSAESVRWVLSTTTLRSGVCVIAETTSLISVAL